MQLAPSVTAGWIVGAAVLLTGCASTDYHYSQLLGERYHRTPIDTYALTVVRVDGQATMRRTALVEPGRRDISVQGPPGGAGGVGDVRTISMDVAPCTRYYLVAVKAQALASDFSVRVDHQERVSGCTAPLAG